jgi:hypothetical protein
MKLPRRQFLHVAASAAALPVVSQIARAQTYPSRPITMIVPYPAGGPTDTIARLLGERMRASLGQPVVIENVAGAGGNIGVGRVAAAGDGYTLSIGHWGSHGAIYTLPYDLLTDLEPVASLAVLRLITSSYFTGTCTGRCLHGGRALEVSATLERRSLARCLASARLQTAQTRPLANCGPISCPQLVPHALPRLLRNGAGVQVPPTDNARMRERAILAIVWPFAQQPPHRTHRQVGKAVNSRPGLCHGRSYLWSCITRTAIYTTTNDCVFTTSGASSSGSSAVPNSII